MDEKTLRALTAPANKLGTTTEYLWDVLLRQAPITGVIDFALLAAWVFLTVMWCRFVMRKTIAPTPTQDDRNTRADWTEEAAFFSWLSAAILVMVTAVIVTVELAITVAALVNPEYWALRQILR